MAKTSPYVRLLLGSIFVFFLLEYIEGRGILKPKQSNKAVGNVGDSLDIPLKGGSKPLLSAYIKVIRCNKPGKLYMCHYIKQTNITYRHRNAKY